MPKKREFNSTEKVILRLLYSRKSPLSAYGVAQRTGITTPTAKKYLTGLVRIDLLVSKSIKKGSGLKSTTRVYAFNRSALSKR